MNWLAHAFLSKPDVDVRLGNLLADLVKRQDRAAMPAAFLEGVRLHHAIDVFTDHHPIVRRSRRRIGGEGFRHVTGVLVDLFYDHFLALDWNRHAAEPLETFTAGLYADLRESRLPLPPAARDVVERMARQDWLGSYRRLDGVETALRRLSQRLSARVGRELKLERGVAELEAKFEALRNDFREFFPKLQEHLTANRDALNCDVDARR